MAKGSQFWGNASGKLGEQVLYRAGGEQRARTYVKNIKNPRTEAQAVNRLSMRNFATAFRAMQSVLRLSFPNRPAKESGFNAFIKANKTAKSAAITPYAMKYGYFCPYGLTISQGSLGAVKGSYFEDIDKLKTMFTFERVNTSGMSLAEVNELVAPLGLVVEDLDSLDAIENRKPTAAQIGAFLSLIGYKSSASVTILTAQYLDEGFKIVPNNVTITLTFNNPYIQCDIHFDDVEDITKDEFYLAVMVSQKVDGKLDVTTSEFVPCADSHEYADQFLQGSESYQEMLDAYVKKTEVLPSAV